MNNILYQDYFEYILKKHDTLIDNSSLRICVNKVQNGNIFTIETGYYLELLMSETIKLLGSTKSKIE